MKFKNGTFKQTQIAQNDIFYVNFKNNGLRDLNVNGTTPVVFTLEDLDVEQVILTRVDFLLSTGAVIDLNIFGNLTSLTNGVLFEIDGTQTFKDNGDILLFATDAETSTGKIGGVDTGLINGHWDLLKTYDNGLVCNVADLKIIIQDDLSTVSYFKISASGLKIN